MADTENYAVDWKTEFPEKHFHQAQAIFPVVRGGRARRGNRPLPRVVAQTPEGLRSNAILDHLNAVIYWYRIR